MSLGILMFALACGADPAEDLRCLSEEQAAEAALYPRLQEEAYAALDRRRERYEELKTPEQIRDYQKRLREFFIEQLGGFPERTPLNAKTVGVIEADGYRIEKVIFDSRPNHRITANFYLPDGEGPFPGVAVSSGHSRTAKTADYNQRFAIAMARNGMAALAFDPIGQGERSQILDEEGKPRISGTTTEHFLIGVGSTLVGRNTASYRVWDAMRALDYLESRDEIDPKRLGMTGCSGGGTLTSYTMALDDRVACAAPACYLTTFRRLIETIGPQDAEQNIYGQVSFGLDQPDYVLLRAPRPTLISSTTGDFFDIEGAWDNFRQAKRIYGRLGRPEQVDLVEIEGGHGVQPQNLATITHWMQRWLLDRDEPVEVAPFAVRTEKELLCTESGQVLRLPGERSVFDLNAEREAELAPMRRKLWEQSSADEMRERVRSLLGVRREAERPAPEWEDVGRVSREDYHIDKVILRTDNAVLPALTFHPPSPEQDDAYLYLNENGKLGDAAAGGEIEKLLAENRVVVSVDLRGQGETGAGRSDSLLGDWKPYYLAYLLGKPLVGIQTEDALTAAHFVAHYQTEKPRRVHLVGVGNVGIVALHAAALQPDRFASVTLRDTPQDWASLVGKSMPEGRLTTAVHSVLEVYDLPDLEKLAGGDKVRRSEAEESVGQD
jgi:cephalosporin-C deacetylase-like acetyl esterase